MTMEIGRIEFDDPTFRAAKTEMLNVTKPFDLSSAFQSGWEARNPKVRNLQDDLARLEKACWYCLDTDIGDPIRHHEAHAGYDGPHWVHYVDPGDGLPSPCSNSEMLERLFQEWASTPLDMLIFCPNCGRQHIDQPEPDICKCGHTSLQHASLKNSGTQTTDECHECSCSAFKIAWDNPPHKSHTCRLDYGGCGHIFRVADVPTNGVAEIKTKGKADTWPEVK